MEKLFPSPHGEPGKIYEDIEFPVANPHDENLPYVSINMVTSVDGRTSIKGKSGKIGGDVDRRVMRILRSRVDAVVSGAGTVKSEKVSMTSEGLKSPEPKAVILTSTMNFPFENLASLEEQETIILAPEEKIKNPSKEFKARIEKLGEKTSIVSVKSKKDGMVDLGSALEILKRDLGVNTILLEGGPSTNNEAVSLGFASEIFITISPKLLGGSSEETTGILSGSLGQAPQSMKLLSIYLSPDEHEVFLRYRLT